MSTLLNQNKETNNRRIGGNEFIHIRKTDFMLSMFIYGVVGCIGGLLSILIHPTDKLIQVIISFAVVMIILIWIKTKRLQQDKEYQEMNGIRNFWKSWLWDW